MYLCAMHRHFKIYKPYGYLSQFIYEKKRHKKLLGELFEFPEKTMAIGRLDEDSEGLLLLTTDGAQSERVRSGQVEKEYFVLVDGIATADAVSKLERGVEIGFKGIRYMTKTCTARLIDDPGFSPREKMRSERHGPTSWISVTVSEGKFRQVRKMTAAVGLPTLRLVRVRIGNLTLDQMRPGEVIELNTIDI